MPILQQIQKLGKLWGTLAIKLLTMKEQKQCWVRMQMIKLCMMD